MFGMYLPSLVLGANIFGGLKKVHCLDIYCVRFSSASVSCLVHIHTFFDTIIVTINSMLFSSIMLLWKQVEWNKRQPQRQNFVCKDAMKLNRGMEEGGWGCIWHLQRRSRGKRKGVPLLFYTTTMVCIFFQCSILDWIGK